MYLFRLAFFIITGSSLMQALRIPPQVHHHHHHHHHHLDDKCKNERPSAWHSKYDLSHITQLNCKDSVNISIQAVSTSGCRLKDGGDLFEASVVKDDKSLYQILDVVDLADGTYSVHLPSNLLQAGKYSMTVELNYACDRAGHCADNNSPDDWASYEWQSAYHTIKFGETLVTGNTHIFEVVGECKVEDLLLHPRGHGGGRFITAHPSHLVTERFLIEMDPKILWMPFWQQGMYDVDMTPADVSQAQGKKKKVSLLGDSTVHGMWLDIFGLAGYPLPDGELHTNSGKQAIINNVTFQFNVFGDGRHGVQNLHKYRQTVKNALDTSDVVFIGSCAHDAANYFGERNKPRLLKSFKEGLDITMRLLQAVHDKKRTRVVWTSCGTQLTCSQDTGLESNTANLVLISTMNQIAQATAAQYGFEFLDFLPMLRTARLNLKKLFHHEWIVEGNNTLCDIHVHRDKSHSDAPGILSRIKTSLLLNMV